MGDEREEKPSSSLDQSDRDEGLLDALKQENSRLKELVVRLSELVIRIVTGKK